MPSPATATEMADGTPHALSVYVTENVNDDPAGPEPGDAVPFESVIV